MAGHFYRSVQKPDVESSTRRSTTSSRRASSPRDGTLHELDLLVLATGFDAHAYVRPMEHRRRGRPHARRGVGATGHTRTARWRCPGFPNLFMLMGPHSPIGNQSLVIIAENQADYAMWWINQIRDGRVVSVAPTEAATKATTSR